MSVVNRFAGELLTFLEQREQRLLTWGFYNVRWTTAEAEDAFESEAPPDLRAMWEPLVADGRTFRGLLREMERSNLLYLVPETIDCYRTRFAEGVRLLANLRQMFQESDWATGPRLVSDIKSRVTPRLYPRRDQSAESVWERLRPHCPPAHAGLMERCFYALASRGETRFHFAGFQVRAFEHILDHYGTGGLTGSVVSAGTGSGKTKAFYVPAFLKIVPELAEEPFTKVIAVYPRNVLLADQLREAIAEAEKLRPVLKAAGLRPIRFGALLGDTPFQHWFDAAEPRSYHWERRGSGTVIPYLKSPADGGRSDLIWRDEDRRAGRTCLYREGKSSPDVPHGVLALTREELRASPPDVLFLSLEMLNREMSSPQWHATFGMRRGSRRSPRLLLLDEVHAHQGLAGAQVAWVLRRWRHWANIHSLHVTGLSATLRDAPLHLSRLAGLSPSQVQEFRPRPGVDDMGEMEAEGAEYQLAVKGDPAAGASLLATSIQTGMLLTRLMTPLHLAPSGPNDVLRPEEFFRKKVFGFSDNLDSVNRWYSDMMDAEKKRLAALRRPPSSSVPEAIRSRRLQEGQVWELPERLGHELKAPLKVTRCSSQDRGTDANSDLIIATSSLEVGFDDPEVGAVLHHKRPGSMSSFIQRKGRAGRTRGARPWTVVVLSDYGADRWAFQSAERLFQPEVDALVLPILNPFVLRIQVTQFLIDWIGRRVGGAQSIFRCLQGPDNYPATQEVQHRTRELLNGLLEQGQTWNEFANELLVFFKRSSGINDELCRQHVEALLWHEPRPLLMRVVPTLLRKLETSWGYAYPPQGATREDAGAGRPLPQFIPKATFTELEVGEAVLELEAYQTPRRKYAREPETMPIARLLFETCPGRISKRFATIPDEPGYWHPHSATLVAGDNNVSVAALYPRHTFIEAVDGILVFQPDAAQAVHRPVQANDASNSSWEWQTLARPHGEGEALPVIGATPWRTAFSEARAFLNSNIEWIEVLRYSEVCSFEMRRQGQSISGFLRLYSGEGEATVREAIGFRIRVDGVRFVLSPEHLTSRPPISDQSLDRFRADYFQWRLATSPILRRLINSFQAEWLAQMSLAMLTATASAHHFSLAEAQSALEGLRPEAAAKVLDLIFQLRGTSVSGADEEARLRGVLLDLWCNPGIRDEIIRLESVLWSAPDAEFSAWVHQRYAATLAQALRIAMVSLTPEVTEEDLAVDVLKRPAGGYDLIVTELSPGGLGQIETIVREMQRTPQRFLNAVEHALSHCSREQGTANLLAVIQTAASESRNGGELANVFEQTRSASSFSEMEETKAQLQAALQSRGFAAVRILMVSIMNKVLRPASSSKSDRLMFYLNRRWRLRSRRLELSIPMRTFAYTYARHPQSGAFLRHFFEQVGGEPATPAQIYSQLQQLLLETCTDSCPECLEHRGRYYDLGKPSRALAREWLDLNIEEVELATAPTDWQERVREVLRQRGRVRVVAGASERQELADALPGLVVTEINLEELRVPVTVASVEPIADQLTVVLQITDFVHGYS